MTNKKLIFISLLILTAGARNVYSFPLLQKNKKSESTPTKGWALTQIEASKAWEISKGSKDVIVAVIDTGVDIYHPDLKDNLWVNPGEVGVDSLGRDKKTNGIDDDGNGYVDDVHGWNFVDRNQDLKDKQEHGTHIAGIIAATDIGVSQKVSIMALKYYDPKATDRANLKNTVDAIRYATKMGAHIINYSAGGLEKSTEEEKAISEARAQNILFVAAAGNEKSNSDLRSFYPADYDLDNIISVTAIDADKRVLDSSNYGVRSVDIAAPGKNIFSTVPGGGYGYMSGTSQATAFVSGAAALLKASRPELSSPQVLIEHLMESGESSPMLIGKTKSRASLNTYQALAMKNKKSTAFGVTSSNLNNNKVFYPSELWD